MSQPVTDYTNTDSIRAVMGLTVSELSDAQIDALLLEQRLLTDLYGWLPTHATVYATGKATGASAEEGDLARNIELYATCFCAATALSSPLHIPQSVTNGKDAYKRFEGADFNALRAQLLAEAALYQQRLDEAVNSATALSTPQLFGSAQPTYDPVTGE